jgi:hypothetical protein
LLPLAKLIYDAIGNDGIKRGELIRKLGFTNFNKGNDELNEIILGRYNLNIIKKLKTALRVDPIEFDSVLKENDLILEIERKMKKARDNEYYRSSFVPYIILKFERLKPKGFSNAVGCSFFKSIKLDNDILKLPIDEQLELVRKRIKEKYSGYNKSHHYYEMMGEILSIKYYFEIDFFVEIDLKIIAEQN